MIEVVRPIVSRIEELQKIQDKNERDKALTEFFNSAEIRKAEEEFSKIVGMSNELLEQLRKEDQKKSVDEKVSMMMGLKNDLGL